MGKISSREIRYKFKKQHSKKKRNIISPFFADTLIDI